MHAPFDPVAAGIMVPKEAEAKKRTRDKTRIEESEGGDATLRGLAVLARAKQDEKKQKADAVVARKEERALKKAELEASAAAQLEAYNKCTPVCTCGLTPCPQAGLVLCTICKDIKKNVCREAACVAAKAPLMLTMAPEALPVPC